MCPVEDRTGPAGFLSNKKGGSKMQAAAAGCWLRAAGLPLIRAGSIATAEGAGRDSEASRLGSVLGAGRKSSNRGDLGEDSRAGFRMPCADVGGTEQG